MKRDAFNSGTEFTYDLGHQLLVDQSWSDTNGVGSDLDEYLWLDGRHVVAFRGKVTGMGVHVTEALESEPALACNRLDEAGGDVHCGAYHLVSNQQNFVVLALSDYDGKVASFALPDVDGQINRPRFVHFGGYLSGHEQKFDVPTSFSKEARFRTVYTGGWVTDYGTWPGVTEMRLTAPDGGVTGISPGGSELRRVTSPWSTAMTGTQNVTWSSVCSSNCASATDMLEWRVWETGGPRFNTRLRFPGQYHDAETDFYENWNRFYDPTTGRYLSSEPLLQKARAIRLAANRGRTKAAYLYAGGNPVAYTDPTGLDFEGNKKSCSADTMKIINKLRSKLRSGNIKAKGCKKVFEDSGITNVAKSDLMMFEILCTDRDKVPDCSGEDKPNPEICGVAAPESGCATVNQNPNRSACPPVAARVGHELGHLAGPIPQGTQHTSGDRAEWEKIEACATKVANEPE